MAINRGERANKLRVKVEYDEAKVLETAVAELVPENHPFKPFLEKCISDSLTRLIIPSLEREIRRELTEKSEKHATNVFATNLKNLLLQPPIRRRRVMAIDPGFKSGCSVAIVDAQGTFIDSDHVYVIGSAERRESSKKKVADLVKQHKIDIIAIGNGAGCRDTEQLVSDSIAEFLADNPVRYMVVNEAGASIYSTSEVGRQELPDSTPAVRSAISIARRSQDPLSELVKISPHNIGVGMYQHDIRAKHLAESLDDVVQFCVNRVGVDVNTASPSLLKFVSGMNSLTAKRVCEYRQENGPFKNRQELKNVSGFGDATFVQAAGFLRINGGDNPLDSTAIHPENYELATELISKSDSTPEELFAHRHIAAASTPTATEVSSNSDDSAAATKTDAEPAKKTDSETSAAAVEATKETAPSAQESKASDETSVETKPQPTVGPKRKAIIDRMMALDLDAIAKEKSIGSMQMTDLVRTIRKPSWDPRDKTSKPIMRRGLIKINDLKPGMQLDAQVVNVVDFGAFVDVGLGESCLVHVSQLTTKFINDPQLVFAVGDVMKVWVVEVDAERRRVKLTALAPGTKKQRFSRSGGSKSRGKGEGGGQGKPGKYGGKPGGNRRGGSKSNTNRREKFARRPPKPKKIIPITEEMISGEAPMRSFSDLLQFKKKTGDEKSDKK